MNKDRQARKAVRPLRRPGTVGRASWTQPARRALAAALLVPALLLAAAGPAAALERVVLQLKWTPAFQFAGYYAAEALGYYRNAGLDVQIVPAGAGVDVVDAVLSGKADYGVGTSSLLLHRAQGDPVVVLAVIFQHSALGLVARRDRPQQSLHDLAGRRVMIEPQSDELLAYLRREGVERPDITLLAHTFNAVGELLAGTVDAASVYTTNEPFFLDRAGFPYQILTPRSGGIDFYGDNLFTSEAELRDHPDRAAAFRDASLRGWAYAMRHPDKVIEIILRHHAPGLDPAFLAFEADRMRDLVRADLVEVGYMHAGRWSHIAETYRDLGLLHGAVSLDGFLYRPPGQAARLDLAPLLPYAAAVAGIGVPAILLGAYIRRTNRRLRGGLTLLSEATEDLRRHEDHYRLLASHTRDVVWTTDRSGRLLHVSPSVETLTGLTAATVAARPLEDLLHPGSRPSVRAAVESLLAAVRDGVTPAPYRSDVELACADGTTRWAELTLSARADADGSPAGLLGVLSDISERRRTAERLRHMARHDPLTGLATRAVFAERLAAALAAAPPRGRRLAVLMVDLRELRAINRRFGHAVGDLVLAAAADRLQQAARAGDTVARLGGGTFLLLFPDLVAPAEADAGAAAVRAALAAPVEVGGHRLDLRCTLALVHHPEDGDDGDLLLRAAENALAQTERQETHHAQGMMRLPLPFSLGGDSPRP